VLGLADPLAGLVVDDVLRRFSTNAAVAKRAYAAFVDTGVDKGLETPHPLVAGTPAFSTSALDQAGCRTTEVIRVERATRSLHQYADESSCRNEAIRRAHGSGAYSLAAIARHFRLHYSTVSKICRTGRA
jgi:hypothetical protein